MDNKAGLAGPASRTADKSRFIPEILPKSGLVYSERGGHVEVLCKPKILPIKSATLQQLEQMNANADADDQ